MYRAKKEGTSTPGITISDEILFAVDSHESLTRSRFAGLEAPLGSLNDGSMYYYKYDWEGAVIDEHRYSVHKDYEGLLRFNQQQNLHVSNPAMMLNERWRSRGTLGPLPV